MIWAHTHRSSSSCFLLRLCIRAQTLEANLLLTCLILPEGSLAPVTLSHVFTASTSVPSLICKLSSPCSDIPGLKPVGKDHMCGYLGYSRAPQMEVLAFRQLNPAFSVWVQDLTTTSVWSCLFLIPSFQPVPFYPSLNQRSTQLYIQKEYFRCTF